MAIAENITTGGTNVAVGAVAGNALTTGIENTILGYNAASALSCDRNRIFRKKNNTGFSFIHSIGGYCNKNKKKSRDVWV